MTAVCTPHHAIAMTMTNSSNGAKQQKPARKGGDSRLVATAADPDGGFLRLTQEKEVIRNG
jgi:hypothetical protein